MYREEDGGRREGESRGRMGISTSGSLLVGLTAASPRSPTTLRLVRLIIMTLKSCAYYFSPTAKWRPGAVLDDANATSVDVLIATGPLPQDSQARKRHEEGLMKTRIAVVAAVVLAIVLPLTVLVDDPATLTSLLVVDPALGANEDGANNEAAAAVTAIFNLSISLMDDNMNEIIFFFLRFFALLLLLFKKKKKKHD